MVVMPLNRCEDDDKPGWKWGDSGKCYVYTAGDEASETAARKKAMAQAAAMGEFPGTGDRSIEHSFPTEILERRSMVTAEDVSFPDRTIELIAVPWDVEAEVVWRSELWREVFMRGAFQEAIDASVRIPVNREHRTGDTVGRIIKMIDDPRGLLAFVKVAKTDRGDETLQLASEGMIGASIGYFVRRMSDVVLDRKAMLRLVKRAFLDHLGMVENPTWAAAEAIAVHDDLSEHPAAGKQRLITPALDRWQANETFAWANKRLAK